MEQLEYASSAFFHSLICGSSFIFKIKMHLVDIAHFYSPENGAVKSYLSAKAKWLSTFGRLRHSIIVPRIKDEVLNHGVLGVPSSPVPFTRDFFMPSSAREVASMLERLQPDCIEVSDPFRFARAALEIGKRNKLPLVAFCHFDLSSIVGQRFGRLAERIMLKYLANLYWQILSAADYQQVIGRPQFFCNSDKRRIMGAQ